MRVLLGTNNGCRELATSKVLARVMTNFVSEHNVQVSKGVYKVMSSRILFVVVRAPLL
ncbi:hypothetical protein MTR67_039144 [Solanum verrucosum]|uniref:Uncharacterized protein n=1 Tax=Solanum verrucosum TaxID=315347 RepID=A0AAF0UH47_SOLVR|nr:hypothetical protein MTR67_039144 [Solanum verrucosum]